jgi:hypothetical protein
VAVRQHRCSRRCSRPHWRIGCCRVPAHVPVVLVRGRAAGRQLDSAQVDRRSPHGAPPTQGCLVPAVGREARHPCQALGEEGPAPRRTGPCLRKFVEPRSLLGVGGGVAQSRLWFGAA